jgi:hypothetical protein
LVADQVCSFSQRPVDSMFWLRAAMEYWDDQGTLNYLLACANLLRGGGCDGFALVDSSDRPVHFLWTAPLEGFRLKGFCDLTAPEPDLVLLFDCWTPYSLRRRDYHMQALHLIANETELSRKNSVVFFSEPYENIGMRTEEVHKEILPALCGLARANGRGVVLKLHPFESVSERSGILQSILAPEDRGRITVESGPLSDSLLSHTWVGVTVESTTVLDCALRRIPCFLCGWLASSLFGYLQQYTKFRVGQVLSSVEDVATIAGSGSSARAPGLLWRVVDPELLSTWLGGESSEPIVVRHKGGSLHA